MTTARSRFYYIGQQIYDPHRGLLATVLSFGILPGELWVSIGPKQRLTHESYWERIEEDE